MSTQHAACSRNRGKRFALAASLGIVVLAGTGCSGSNGKKADPAGASTTAKGGSKGSTTTPTSVKPNFAFTVTTAAKGVPSGAATPVSLSCETIEANGNKQLIATWGAVLNGNYAISGTMRGVKGSDQFAGASGPGAANLTLNGDSAHALQRSSGTFTVNGDLKSGKADLEFGSGPSVVKVQGTFTCP